MRPNDVPESLLSAEQVTALRENLDFELGLYPNWPDLWNLQGLLEALVGARDKACNSFVVALGRNPAYATARWNLAWAHLLGGSPEHPDESSHKAHEVKGGLQPTGLLPVLRNLLKGGGPEPEWRPLDPALAVAGLAIAARQGDNDAFDQIFRSLQARDSGMQDLLRSAELWSGDAPDLDRIAALGVPDWLNPGLAELLERGARLESMSGRYREALRLYAVAALYRGDRAAYLVEKADILGRSGRGEEALPLLRESVRVNPDWYRSHLALGYELSVRGEHEEALVHLQQALRIKPGYADVQYQCALLLHASGRNVDAIEALKTALERNPQYLVARIALANLLFESKRETEAIPHFERVFDEGFQSPFLWGRFGYAMHTAGDQDRAEEVFLEAIAEDQDRPEVLCLYGLFLADTGREIEARTIWERALRADPAPDVQARIEGLLGNAPVDE
jgi:tetratricopeptide (TPR) repeat protein